MVSMSNKAQMQAIVDAMLDDEVLLDDFWSREPACEHTGKLLSRLNGSNFANVRAQMPPG